MGRWVCSWLKVSVKGTPYSEQHTDIVHAHAYPVCMEHKWIFDVTNSPVFKRREWAVNVGPQHPVNIHRSLVPMWW